MLDEFVKSQNPRVLALLSLSKHDVLYHSTGSGRHLRLFTSTSYLRSPLKMFKDDFDRNHFLDRLGKILTETATSCYAWALIPNHVHL
jgi:hypothetical protein